MIGVPAFACVVVAYFYWTGGRYENTDDAYVQVANVAVSSNVAGRVLEVNVHDNQTVRKGDVLFSLDSDPFRIAVEEAQAQLASARLQVESLKASYRQQQAQLTAARETLEYQKRETDRQKRLLTAGIASQLQVDRVVHALEGARSELAAAEQAANAVVANLGGNPNVEVERHPTVQHAQAVLDRAKLNLSYTVIKAPAAGIVTRVEQLQAGSYISASAPVFALVVANDTWVEANFKENQLAHMRVGQQVEVRVDSYPGRKFAGTVASVSPGTGSQFSLLPAENATGNWVKVVQRLPVRIELQNVDPDYPLHGGLSATVNVDTRYERHLFGADESPRRRSPSAGAHGPGGGAASSDSSSELAAAQ